jgi:type II secretory pathway pseudopilin PulG
MVLNFKKNAFTVSEVMITLGLIGVLASLTISTIGSSVQQKARTAEFRTAFSKLNTSLKSITHDKGNVYACYDANLSSDYKEKYGLTVASGLQSNSDGCSDLMNELIHSLGFTRICQDNPISEGCIPSTYKQNGENPKDFKTVDAYVLENSMIMFFMTSQPSAFFAIDVNGVKGPNRWGLDIFPLEFVVKDSVLLDKTFFVKEVEILPPAQEAYEVQHVTKSIRTSAKMLEESVGYQE